MLNEKILFLVLYLKEKWNEMCWSLNLSQVFNVGVKTTSADLIMWQYK